MFFFDRSPSANWVTTLEFNLISPLLLCQLRVASLFFFGGGGGGGFWLAVGKTTKEKQCSKNNIKLETLAVLLQNEYVYIYSIKNIEIIEIIYNSI